MKRLRIVTLAVALTGCAAGSTGNAPRPSGGEAFVPASPPRPTRSPAPVSTPTPSEEQRSADQIMADAVSALERAPAVHLSGHSTDDQGTALVELDKTPDGARQVTTDSSGTDTVIVAGGRAYGARAGRTLAELAPGLSAELQALTLSRMAACLRREHGSYSKGEVSTINGRRVVAVIDDGRAVGAAPSTLFVALDGPPLPVRLTIDGRVRPGGAADCGHPLDATVTSASFDFDFSRAVAPVTPPPG